MRQHLNLDHQPETPAGATTSASTFAAEVRDAATTKALPCEWTRRLDALYASLPLALEGMAAARPLLLPAAALYAEVHDSAPVVAELLLERVHPRPECAEFLELHRVYLRAGLAGDDAAAMALAAVARRKEAPSPTIVLPALEAAAARMLGTWGGRTEPYRLTMTDVAMLRQRAKLYPGLSSGRVIDEAMQWFKTTHTLVNGRAVYTAAANTPSDFAELVPDLLEIYVRLFGAEAGIADASTLSVVPMTTSGAGVWMIVDAASGMPVPNLADGLIRAADLGEFRVVEFECGEDAATAGPVLAS